MFNSKNPKISGNKRSAFLPADVRKEFGCFVKKPRLEVRLTPLTPHSPNKTNSNSSGKDSVDEIWGEELPEEAIEECEFLATQAYQEASVVRNVSVCSTSLAKTVLLSNNNNNGNASSTKNISNGLCGFSEHPGVSSHNTFNSPYQRKEPIKLSSRPEEGPKGKHFNNVKLTIPDPYVGEQDRRNLENENKELKEKFLQKEGEVAILRSQMKQLQIQLEAQKLDHMKSLETQAQKFTKQLNERKKELDVTNTQLQFQIMEATSMRNHCKVLESGSKIKLIEPRPVCAESPRKKREIQREDSSERRPGVSNSAVSSPNVKSKKSVAGQFRILAFNEIKPIRLGVREGSVLGLLVNEYLTAKSQPDTSWILYIRKKQSLCRKIKEAEGINSKILNLQKSNQTLESCYSPVNQLITLDAVSSTAAYFYVETIIKECQRILCRQMHILHLLCSVQSYTERGTLNGVVASVIGTAATKTNCNLMSAGRWYDEEEGIESRRALGLLCALCDMSGLASELTYGSKTFTNYGDVIVHKTLNDMDEKEGTTISTVQKKDKILYTEYLTKPFGFLHLLRDIVFSISFQRRTRHFVGLLTGILKLLTAIARTTSFVDQAQELLSEIIRELVFCRPQLEVVVTLFELLASLACYPVVMKSFCVNSGCKTFIEMKPIGLAYFTRESCVTQVLFRLLPTCATSVSLRTDLYYYMVHWLYFVMCFSGREAYWLLAVQENKKITCNCREMLASGVVTTLYSSLCDLDVVALESTTKWKLLETLKKGIVLLRVWHQQEEEYWKYFAKDNFAYQLWLSKLKTDVIKMNLSDLESECVKELLGKPEESNDVTSESEDEDGEYWNIISNDCKVLFTEQR